MDEVVEKTTLVKAAEDFLATAKSFDDGFGTIFRLWDTINVTAALDLLTSTGILERIPTEGSIGSKELAEAVDLDESVIQRAMRVICAQGIGEEPETDNFAHNEKSLAYVGGPSKSYFKVCLDYQFAFRQLPRYFKTHSREDIRDIRKSPYAFAHNLEGMTYYEAVSADAERFQTFNDSLGQMDKAMPVLGMFPFSSLKAQVEAETNRPFIVDVGGGIGTVVQSILQEAPAGFGAQVILQDRPDVIDSIPQASIPYVTKMAHDFFTPQPVKNAHLYLLRRILHDFYEPQCIQIVKNIASAMGPTSRLLIGDFVVPEKTHIGDDFMIYWMDFSMMMLTGKEKTAKQFEMILNEAGLELVKIWPFAFGAQAMVEARLKA